MPDDLPEYTHENLLSDAKLGNKPTEAYLEVVDMLDNVVRECMYVSRSYAGIPSPTSRHYYASVLFTALITRGVSLAHLMPFSPWSDKKIEHWDYASVAVITRTMLELRLAFYYLCVDTCSQAEWDCRWNIFNLHDCTSRIRLFEAAGDHEQLQGFATQSEELRERLHNNTYFQSLSTGRQKQILNGQVAYLQPLEEIAERAGLDRPKFRWLYVLLSSHVHGLPMSFYRLGERGRGLPSPAEEGYTSMCLSLVSTFLVKTRDEVHALFKDFKDRADEIIRSESQAADTVLAESTKIDSLKVGETILLTETDDLAVEVTMTAKDVVQSVYRCKITGEEVLRRTDADDGVSLDMFDPFYWTLAVNGKPVTHTQLDEVMRQPHAFKIDHTARTIDWKTSEGTGDV